MPHSRPFILLNETRAKEAISVQSMTQAVRSFESSGSLAHLKRHEATHNSNGIESKAVCDSSGLLGRASFRPFQFGWPVSVVGTIFFLPQSIETVWSAQEGLPSGSVEVIGLSGL